MITFLTKKNPLSVYQLIKKRNLVNYVNNKKGLGGHIATLLEQKKKE